MKADILDLKTLFGKAVSYRIPQFQRPYAWKEDTQWKPLWDDIRKVSTNILGRRENSKTPPHFMGAIVLQHQDGGTGVVDQRIVVDGQQRLTTLQLFISAARDVFQGLDHAERVKRLEELTLNEESYWGKDPDNQTKIRQSNIHDQQAFQNVIRSLPGDRKSLHSIGQAYQYFKKEISRWLNENPSNRKARADAMEETLTKYLQLAAIDLDEAEKPHFIFGVLNARAEPLKESDLVKNTIMYEADVVDDAKKAKDLWGMFDIDDWWREDTKEGRLTRIHLDRFLNYWMIMQTRGDVTADRVSSAFSDYVESVKPYLSIEELTKEIKKAGQLYQDMENAKHPGIEIFMKRMKIMELGVVMPPLLWLYTRDISEEKRKRSIQAIESYLVRRMLCGLSSMGLNKLFIELVRKLEEGGADQADGTLINYLSEQTVDNRIWPKDNMLGEDLIKKPLKANAVRQKMVLYAIETRLRSDKTEKLGQISNLTVEHIMPKSWDQKWPLSEDVPDQDAAKDSRDQAVKVIGNLTLVTDKLNKSLSNGPWREKREALKKHSILFLNRKLLPDDGAHEVWDESAIHKRSEELAGMIAEIWPYADKI